MKRTYSTPKNNPLVTIISTQVK